MAGRDFAKRFDKLDNAVIRGRTDTVKAAAQAAKVEHLRVLRQDSGGDLHLSHVGRRKGRQGGRKVGVNYKVETSGQSRASATIRPTGPVGLLERDIVGHVIRSSYLRGALRQSKGQSQVFGPAIGKVSGGSRRTVLRTPYGWRQSVRHKGTTGKRTWTRGRRKATPKVTTVMQRQTRNIVKRGFG
jgi:hypothetical protein